MPDNSESSQDGILSYIETVSAKTEGNIQHTFSTSFDVSESVLWSAVSPKAAGVTGVY